MSVVALQLILANKNTSRLFKKRMGLRLDTLSAQSSGRRSRKHDLGIPLTRVSVRVSVRNQVQG